VAEQLEDDGHATGGADSRDTRGWYNEYAFSVGMQALPDLACLLRSDHLLKRWASLGPGVPVCVHG